MKNNGYAETTIETIGNRLRNLSKQVDMNNPEKVKEYISNQTWKSSYKENMVNAYNHYTITHTISWRKPIYLRSSSLKKLPLESDIDLIISHAMPKSTIAYRLVKECGLRPIEVERLRLKDIDLNSGVVYPEIAKGSEPRAPRMKSETLAMLKSYLNRNNFRLKDNIFSCSKTLQKNWNKLRNSLAERYSKPELKQIRLYDLRHYYGSMIYRKTKDIVYTQRMMGHKNIKNTLRYIHLVGFKDDEWICKVAKTIEESTNLIESGFEYVTEMDDMKLFRKRK
jgi:integrase